MSQLSRADVADWYLKAGHRRVWVVPLSVVLAVFVVFLVLRDLAEDPSANLVKSRAALKKYERAVADEDNVFFAVSQTWTLRPPWAGGPYDSPRHRALYEPELLKDANSVTYWKNCSAELAALKLALKKPKASFGFNIETRTHWASFFSLSDFRESAALLAFDASMHAQRGEHTKAVESLKEVHLLARLMQKDSALIGLMMSLGNENLGSTSFVPWLLNAGPPLDDAALKLYQDSLVSLEKPHELLAETLEFERHYSSYLMDRVYANKQGAFIGGRTDTPLMEALVYGSERSSADSIYREFVDALRKGTPPRTIDVAKHQRGPAGIIRYSVNPRMWLAMLLEHSHQKIVHTALSVARFQHKYKRDPKSLEELVPEFLPAVPVDFYGKPLRLRAGPFDDKLWTSFGQGAKFSPGLTLMIYSFGMNQKDDHGESDQKNNGDEPDDFSLLLRSAEKGTTP